ncbi:MAG TPA: DegT/DnrJ/EryC1/StrS family aminotransferase [Candidatus Dormibacteraeota bacterium]|nr:DegT/DnrJ/EryC1/StrS family aminotransferase [Candidatus Dormibacteraeota bacterium]
MPKDFVPVARPHLGREEVSAAERVILSGWVTQGPEVAALEREFAAFVGASHACAVSSGTTALHLALLAVGVRPGDEVVTVSHSYIATANSIRYCGARPVFVDIEPATFNIDPARIEPAISEKTRAILCVHQMGMPCDLNAIIEIARRHKIAVVEDAACAIGSEIHWNGNWEKIGRPHGDVACFSFHPRKLLTTGDGGMLTTANPEIDRNFRLWRQHGMSVPDTVRHSSSKVVFESYPELGFNYRLTDIQAAIGREQLKRLPAAISERRQMAARYGQLLGDVREVVLPSEPTWARTNWQSYCIRLAENLLQQDVMQRMLDEGIATRRGIMCAHREPAYSDPATWRCPRVDCQPGPGCPNLVESERAQDHGVILPLFSQMTKEQQERVGFALRDACSSRNSG